MSEESKELFENAKNTSLDEAYNYCLKLEYNREYSWRDGLQGGFESSMHSYDNLVDSFEDPSKIQILSDNGKGKENICISKGPTPDAPAIITVDIQTNGVSIGADKFQYVSGDV